MVPGGFSTVGADFQAAPSSDLGDGVVPVFLAGSGRAAASISRYASLVRAAMSAPVRRRRASSHDQEPTALTDGSDLPTIDLLLPAYDAADVIEHAIRSIRAADYPADRQRLHVITEPDDTWTWAALRALSDTYDFGVYEVPADYPGEPSDPRALNYAYVHTDAEVIGVVDVDVRVPAGLFRAVAAAVRDRRCAVALAHLDGATANHRWRSRVLGAEYGSWYDRVVPTFARPAFPVPLHDTCCFARRTVLDHVAEERFERDGSPWSLADRLWLLEHDLHRPVPWDPDSGAEAFELERSLWEAGYAFTYLDPVPSAGSAAEPAAWPDQRVRGQEGKL